MALAYKHICCYLYNTSTHLFLSSSTCPWLTVHIWGLQLSEGMYCWRPKTWSNAWISFIVIMASGIIQKRIRVTCACIKKQLPFNTHNSSYHLFIILSHMTLQGNRKLSDEKRKVKQAHTRCNEWWRILWQLELVCALTVNNETFTIYMNI